MPAVLKGFPSNLAHILVSNFPELDYGPLQTMKKSAEVIILTGHIATFNKIRLILERKGG